MSMTLNTLLDNPTAAVFGAAGLACQLAWPLFSKRRSMLAVQMGVGSNFAVQYALLDAWSGTAVCALGASQTLVALLVGERPWLRYVGLAFLPAVVAAGLATWAGLHTLFALSALTLVMIGRLQQDTVRLRQFMLAAIPFGMSYDLSVGAAPALIGAFISLVIGFGALRRELRKRAGGATDAAQSGNNRILSIFPIKGGAHQTKSA